MAASFVTSSLRIGHIATAMLPLCNNELTERCYHFGFTFVIKQPLILYKFLSLGAVQGRHGDEVDSGGEHLDTDSGPVSVD